jgi:probable F420-dependent oxidoreductase
MSVGVGGFVTDRSMSPTALAIAAEERGFESLFLAEHSHVPTMRVTPYAGGELPEEYYRCFDSIASLAAAAAVTSTLLLGTGVSVISQHDPIMLAKATATLDHISGGRLIFGVGVGWNREEMAHHGTDPSERWAVCADRLVAIRKIWTLEVASHEGPGATFGPMFSWPKPLQVPAPAVLIGGVGPKALEWAAAEGDGWLPAEDRLRLPLEKLIQQLDRMTEERGRPALPVSVFGAAPSPAHLSELQALGISRAILRVPSESPDRTRTRLDGWIEAGLTGDL